MSENGDKNELYNGDAEFKLSPSDVRSVPNAKAFESPSLACLIIPSSPSNPYGLDNFISGFCLGPMALVPFCGRFGGGPSEELYVPWLNPFRTGALVCPAQGMYSSVGGGEKTDDECTLDDKKSGEYIPTLCPDLTPVLVLACA